MSLNRIVNPGFGFGQAFGTPVTVGVAATSTVNLTGTVLPVGQYFATGLVAGTRLELVSTSNGVTGTWTVLSASPGFFLNDGSSARVVNTTTTVSIVFIPV